MSAAVLRTASRTERPFRVCSVQPYWSWDGPLDFTGAEHSADSVATLFRHRPPLQGGGGSGGWLGNPPVAEVGGEMAVAVKTIVGGSIISALTPLVKQVR